MRTEYADSEEQFVVWQDIYTSGQVHIYKLLVIVFLMHKYRIYVCIYMLLSGPHSVLN